MHTNHRRKKGRYSPKKTRGRYWGPYSLKEERRIAWKRCRAEVRDLIRRSFFDRIQSKYYKHIFWDWW